MLDSRIYDEDVDDISLFADELEDENETPEIRYDVLPKTEDEFKRRAEEVYKRYETQYKKRFR